MHRICYAATRATRYATPVPRVRAATIPSRSFALTPRAWEADKDTPANQDGAEADAVPAAESEAAELSAETEGEDGAEAGTSDEKGAVKGKGAEGPPSKTLESWIAKEGRKFQRAKFGQTNWLGKRGPFPMNPAFTPRPPISDAQREHIYSIWYKNPDRITPRILANRFNLSIVRIEAIIKLKVLEKRMEADQKPLLHDLTRSMEGLLGVPKFTQGGSSSAAVNASRIREPAVQFVPDVGAPMFRAVDEEEAYTSADAARSLDRPEPESNPLAKYDKPFAFIDRHELLRNEKKKADKVVLSKNPLLTNRRWDFMFTDTNPTVPAPQRTIVVRETDGTLRQATKLEREYRLKDLWPQEASHVYR
ncbi:hypothetical protein IWQ60_009931 [Tieghemiomyces parasiticus]|uniref:37S ribosomal protein S35, mitochondrial n=1 Tax=Tieghemiomyces parasiticus TaxID=78921 RepID=A0A9W7ZLE2_9FUNG|nr:hypothetical protein IWQ60_009931 [Tieghemiomyces parasiticus]